MSNLALLAATVLAAGVSDPVTLELEPVDAEATISSVTLYRGRAAVTRSTTLDLAPGGWSIHFRNLSLQSDRDSIQASVDGNAKLMAVDTSRYKVVTQLGDRIEELDAEIRRVEDEIADVAADAQAVFMQLSLIESVVETGEGEGLDDQTIASRLTFVARQVATLHRSAHALERNTEALKDELKVLRSRRQSIASDSAMQLDAIVDVAVLGSGPVTVELTYLVSNASWEPTYSIHAAHDGTVIIDYEAELAQRTGEDWKDVRLELSTAQPQRSASPPMPPPLFVDIRQPPPPPSAGSTRGRGLERVNEAPRIEADTALGMNFYMEKAIAGASVVGDGPAVSFALPRTISVPSSSEESQRTAIASIETDATIFRVAVPMLTDAIFVRSRVTNDSPYILLPGQASIFHGSDFVGKTQMGVVAPGQGFDLDLGIDPAMISQRTIMEKETSETGLFGSGRKTTWAYRVTISNGHDTEMSVRLWDRIPVSRNEGIKVEFKDASAPLSTDAAYIKTRQPLGLLRWDLVTAAGATGDDSSVLTWTVTLARGKDIEITPLPE